MAKKTGRAKDRARSESRAAERAARVAELESQRREEERRRRLMVGGVVGLVLVMVVAVLWWVGRGDDVDAPAAGQSQYGVTVGDEGAPRTLVLYEDFLCPGCGQLEEATGDRLAELAADGAVYLDYRPFELLGRFGDYSARSTAAFGVVLDVAGPEVAKEFHDLLFADQPSESADSFPDADWLVDKAVEAGAVEAEVRPGIEAGENDFSAGATRQAEEAGVQGTPTVILDGEPFTGSPQDLLDELG